MALSETLTVASRSSTWGVWENYGAATVIIGCGMQLLVFGCCLFTWLSCILHAVWSSVWVLIGADGLSELSARCDVTVDVVSDVVGSGMLLLRSLSLLGAAGALVASASVEIAVPMLVLGAAVVVLVVQHVCMPPLLIRWSHLWELLVLLTGSTMFVTLESTLPTVLCGAFVADCIILRCLVAWFPVGSGYRLFRNTLCMPPASNNKKSRPKRKR